MSKPTIGFIGLGLMGGAMVEGFKTKVIGDCNLPTEPALLLIRAVARGATEVATAQSCSAGL